MESIVLNGIYHIGFCSSRHIVMTNFWRGQLQTWNQVFYKSSGHNSKRQGIWFPILCIEENGHFMKGIVVPPHKRRKNPKLYEKVKTYLPHFYERDRVIQPSDFVQNYDHSSVEKRCLYKVYTDTSAILSELITYQVKRELEEKTLLGHMECNSETINRRIDGFYQALNGNPLFMFPVISNFTFNLGEE